MYGNTFSVKVLKEYSKFVATLRGEMPCRKIFPGLALPEFRSLKVFLITSTEEGSAVCSIGHLVAPYRAILR